MDKEQMLKDWDKRIKTMAWHYDIPGMDWDDLQQELRICLCKCIDLFEPDRGIQFNTFFYTCARQVMHQLYEYSNRLKRRGQTVPLSDNISCNFGYEDIELKASIDMYDKFSDDDRAILSDFIEGRDRSVVRLRKVNSHALKAVLSSY